MSEPADALEAGLRLAASLEAHGVPYALGGALAYGQYGIPRATNDVDVNVFVEPGALRSTFDALQALGIAIDETKATAAATAEGLFVVRYGLFRLDVFTPSIPFAWRAGESRVVHTVDGRRVWFLSAEALCVFKLLFFRGKDVVDLERLIAVHGDRLDGSLVRREIVAMLGEDDPRVSTWDRLLSEHMPS